MRGTTFKGVLAAGLGALCAVALSCGSDSKLLAGGDADGLKDTLGSVQEAVDARDCAATDARLDELRSALRNLPQTVSPRLRSRLRSEVEDDLAPRARFECGKAKQETVPTTTEPVPTGPTSPAEEEPPEETTSTETTPAPVDPPAETEPPADPEVPVDPIVPAPPADEGTGGFGEGEG